MQTRYNKQRYNWIIISQIYTKSTTMEAQQTQQQPQEGSSRLTARLLDFIDIHPSHIQQTFYSEASSKLYVSRKLYSEVYSVIGADDAKSVSIQQIMVFQPCEYIYEIDGLIVMVFPFELKINNLGRWIIYPFTTQLLPNSTKWDDKNNKLYTFHVNECRQWSISQSDGIDIRHLSRHETPYHITAEGTLEGYGKKIKPNNFKDNKFTFVQISECRQFLFVGSDKGHLHIYQTKYLTHIKTFHRHEAAILNIKTKQKICYFTGSDSKISSIVYVTNDSDDSGNWVLSKQVRGQSHDVMSLQCVDFKINGKSTNYLISGGITTDICFYKLAESRVLTEEWAHKVSYSCEKLAECARDYIIVNKFTTFQIWKVADSEHQSKQGVELLVKYEMPFYKNIRQIIAKADNKKSVTIFVRTQQQATLWTFDEVKGLHKTMTVKNNYNLAVWHKKDNLITIRDGNKLEVLNYKTGHIKQIAQTGVEYPTDLKLSPIREDKILIGSRFSKQVQVWKMNNQNNGKSLSKLTLSQEYNILDFCYYNTEHLMIKYSTEQVVKEIDRKGSAINQVVKLPIKKVRDFGWLSFFVNEKKKIFWFVVSEGKIIVVSRMRTLSKDKKVRVKQMPRIGTVISRSISTSRPQTQNQAEKIQLEDWNLGVIPLNFSKMIAEQVNPIMTKKIL